MMLKLRTAFWDSTWRNAQPEVKSMRISSAENEVKKDSSNTSTQEDWGMKEAERNFQEAEAAMAEWDAWDAEEASKA